MIKQTLSEQAAAGWEKYARIMLLCVATLLPAITIFHRDETGRWTLNRCAMAAPDELSYLLMARNFATGHGASIQNLANDETFYPPGLPLILAGWSKGVDLFGGKGLSIESLHVCVSLILCATVLLVYAVSRRLVGTGDKKRFAEWAAVGIALLYATNWYVLETALFLFSEPAFILVTLIWLLVALRVPKWYESTGYSLLMVGLALGAMAIRVAGVVCLAATVAYPVLIWWGNGRKRMPWKAVAAGVVMGGVYFAAMHALLPQSQDSYSSQLLFGITDHGVFPRAVRERWWDLGIWVRWAGHILHLMVKHFDDWAANFGPPYREDVPRTAIYILFSRVLMLVCVAGWLGALMDGRRGGRFVAVYVGFYVLLYALWPFDMTRFWVPIYPVMLAYSVMAVRDFSRAEHLGARWAAGAANLIMAVCGGLLLVASLEELYLVLPYYQRRLNYVSDVLAQTADFVKKHSPEGRPILVVAGGDEAKTMAWYMGVPPQPGLKGPRGIERQIEAQMEQVKKHPGGRLFVMSYFTHDLFLEVFANLHLEKPDVIAAYEEPRAGGATEPTKGKWTIQRRLQIWNITDVWEMIPPIQ